MAAKKKTTRKTGSGNKAGYKNSPFVAGNQLWRHGSFNPVPRKITDPQKLHELCVEYFDYVENNPLYETVTASYKGMIEYGEVPKMRAMTIEGLCIHIGISVKTWRRWKAEPKADVDGNVTPIGEAILAVQEWAETIIRQQKFEGAAAGMLNPLLIARDLGLKDNQKVVTDDGEGGDAPMTAPVLILPSNGREADDSGNEE